MHEHDFKFVKILEIKPIPPDYVNAYVTSLYRCECGHEKTETVIGKNR